MKKLLVVVCVLVVASAQARNIEHNDIIKRNFLHFNLDGIELWDIAEEDVEEATDKFYQRCLVDIPARNRSQQESLEKEFSFFSIDKLKTTYRVVKNKTSLGTQLLCFSTFKTHPNANFYFKNTYSRIFKDRNGTLDICKEKVAKIDETSVKDGIIVRRAYFVYGKNRAGEVIFPECQTLKVQVTEKPQTQRD